MIYLDTSYLGRIYMEDEKSPMIHKLIGSNDQIVCCIHGKAELFSAFHRRFREGVYSLSQIRKMMEQVHLDTLHENISWISLDEKTISHTEKIYSVAPRDCFLRGADALHLACARENGFKEIYSNDKHLLAAAPLFGLKGKNIFSTDSLI